MSLLFNKHNRFFQECQNLASAFILDRSEEIAIYVLSIDPLHYYTVFANLPLFNRDSYVTKWKQMVAYLVRKAFPGKYTDEEAIVAAEQITASMVPARQPTPLFSICRTNLAEGESSPNLSGRRAAERSHR